MKHDQKSMSELKTAVNLLENPSLTIRFASFIGAPIEMVISKLPDGASEMIYDASRKALQKATEVALWSMDTDASEIGTSASPIWHKLAGVLTGTAGGLFGLPGLLIELPVSTTIIMRAIADIARSEGFDLTDEEVQKNCLEVFALGGKSEGDDAAETAYYIVRGALNQALNVASAELMEKAAIKTVADIAPKLTPQKIGSLIAQFITIVAERFGIMVTEKVAAQIVPAIGAISGAIINTLFMDHFQDMARGHFIVKRLEKHYGMESVEQAYRELASGLRNV